MTTITLPPDGIAPFPSDQTTATIRIINAAECAFSIDGGPRTRVPSADFTIHCVAAALVLYGPGVAVMINKE